MSFGEYYLVRYFGELKAKTRELMLKVDNIILLWRIVILNSLNHLY